MNYKGYKIYEGRGGNQYSFRTMYAKKDSNSAKFSCALERIPKKAAIQFLKMEIDRASK